MIISRDKGQGTRDKNEKSCLGFSVGRKKIYDLRFTIYDLRFTFLELKFYSALRAKRCFADFPWVGTHGY
jgi:hypothetical protein